LLTHVHLSFILEFMLHYFYVILYYSMLFFHLLLNYALLTNVEISI